MKSVDTPLSEITLRRYERPRNLSHREAARKVCLTLGLLNPGDSRDVIVDVLMSLLRAASEKKMLSSDEIAIQSVQIRKEHKMDDQGTAGSNIRRQIKRLRDSHIVEKIKTKYRILEFLSLSEIFKRTIQTYQLASILERGEEYMQYADSLYRKDL